MKYPRSLEMRRGLIIKLADDIIWRELDWPFPARRKDHIFRGYETIEMNNQCIVLTSTEGVGV